MDKTYTQAKEILDRISRNTDEWVDDGYGSRYMDKRRSQARMIDTDATSNLSAQIANMTSLLQTIALNNQGGTVASMDAMNTVNTTASVSCVQCGEGHLYDMCPYNPQSVCYVQNNPYSKTYNPGWRNHPNFGWGGNQAQTQGNGQQPQRNNNPVYNQGVQGHQAQRNQSANSSSSSLEALMRQTITQNEETRKSLEACSKTKWVK